MARKGPMTEEQRKRKNATIVAWRARQSPEKREQRLEAERQRRREFTAEHKEKLNAKARKVYSEKIEASRERSRNKQKSLNPAQRARYLAHCHKRRAKIAAAGGSYTAEEWADVVASYDHC